MQIRWNRFRTFKVALSQNEGRHFCSSGHQKRVVEFGEGLCSHVLRKVPHRHVACSIPKILRRYFLGACPRPDRGTGIFFLIGVAVEICTDLKKSATRLFQEEILVFPGEIRPPGKFNTSTYYCSVKGCFRDRRL